MEMQSRTTNNATMRTYSKRTRGGLQTFSIKRRRLVDSSGEEDISLISPSSAHSQEDIINPSSTKSRVLSPTLHRSTSPLAEVTSNHQNRRDHGISPPTFPDPLNRTLSQNERLTSTDEASSCTPDPRANSRSKDKIILAATQAASSFTPERTSSARRDLASNHTGIDLDSLQLDKHQETAPASRESLTTPLSNTVVPSKSRTVEKVNKSSILSYFKPLPQRPPVLVPPRSSSPVKSQSSTLPDSPQPVVISPPSSPPPIPRDTVNSTRSKSVRRRISTKPNLPNINKMSDYFDNDMQELGGDFTDASRIEMMERYHDAQDMRDHAIIDHGTLIPLAEQALDIPARVKLDADLARPKPFALHQQILDLGQSFQNKCPNCGMQYAINVATDRGMHDKFHNVFRMGGPTFKPKYDKTQIWTKVIEGEKHSIQCVSCKEPGAIRNLVESILEATLMDMDGTLPSSEQIWSTITSPNDPKDRIPVPRYKVFLYLIGARPIGILLAERIGKAHAIAMTAAEPEIPTPVPHDAYMCIDRLWVHSDFRRKGIATSLATQAREKFIPGLVMEKREVAVSQPTSVGGQFAERYFKGVFEGARFAVACTLG